MMSTYRLSRNFFTTTYNEPPMSEWVVKIKSGIALSLGIIPFGLIQLCLPLFRYMSSLNFASLGLLSAFLTMLSAKGFSLSQWLVWGKYVPNPSGDTINSRLAQYGSGEQPWIDLDTIFKAFYFPEKLKSNEWKLDQWKLVNI